MAKKKIDKQILKLLKSLNKAANKKKAKRRRHKPAVKKEAVDNNEKLYTMMRTMNQTHNTNPTSYETADQIRKYVQNVDAIKKEFNKDKLDTANEFSKIENKIDKEIQNVLEVIPDIESSNLRNSSPEDRYLQQRLLDEQNDKGTRSNIPSSPAYTNLDQSNQPYVHSDDEVEEVEELIEREVNENAMSTLKQLLVNEPNLFKSNGNFKNNTLDLLASRESIPYKKKNKASKEYVINKLIEKLGNKK